MNTKKTVNIDEKVTSVRPGVKVWLGGEINFFGPGTVKLLEKVDELGSVREACTDTNLSYSKGWKLIHKAEEQLGYTIVDRAAGGKKGGKAVLTEKGRTLLELFKEYDRQVAAAARNIYQEVFEGSQLFQIEQEK